MTTARKVRAINYIAYGSNDILGAGAMAVISGWVLFFYTTFCGLSALQAATIFAVARVLDAIASPLIGYLSDNFYRTRLGRRFGRRRFFILVAIPLMPMFALMWVSGMHFWYYLVTYVAFELIYALELIPYETLAAEMTNDYKAKAKFAGSRILFGQVSAILAGILPGQIIEVLGKESSDTFLYLGIIFSVLFMLVAFAVWRFSWERPREQVIVAGDPQAMPSIVDNLRRLYSDLGSTLRIRAFRLHLGMYLGGYISQDVFNAVFTYFVIFALGSTVAATSGLLGTVAFAQLVAVAIAIPMVLRFHPAPAYRIAVGFYIVGLFGLVSLFAFRPENVVLWLYVPVIAVGLARGALNYIPWNTYNYMADVDEIVTGRRREGIFAGVMTFVRKATQALAVMFVGLTLDVAGFESGAAEQSSTAIWTIVSVMFFGTFTVLIAGFLVSRRFHLNSHTHEVLMGEIEQFKSGSPAPISAERRAVVEDLSGWPYEKLWGRNNVAGEPAAGAPSPAPAQG